MRPGTDREPARRATGRRSFVVVALLAVACTQDFSVFDVSGRGSTDGGAGGSQPSGDAAAGGATSSTGGAGTGGGASTGGATSGGASGGDASGTGGQGTGGAGTGGAGTGGAGTGGAGTGGVGTGGSGSGGANTGGSSQDSGTSCDALYSAAPGYVLCTETATTCRFGANTNGGSCRTVCSDLGGNCLDQDDNGNDACTATNPTDDCNTTRQNAICVCTR
ncbi:MAG TPA: hypothetical protein VHE30_17260 [Polyangiaceae bacterium]|nr:hypothetical protein [Polyangiaceae bacterium]